MSGLPEGGIEMVLVMTMLVGLIGAMFFGTMASAVTEMRREMAEDKP